MLVGQSKVLLLLKLQGNYNIKRIPHEDHQGYVKYNSFLAPFLSALKIIVTLYANTAGPVTLLGRREEIIQLTWHTLCCVVLIDMAGFCICAPHTVVFTMLRPIIYMITPRNQRVDKTPRWSWAINASTYPSKLSSHCRVRNCQWYNFMITSAIGLLLPRKFIEFIRKVEIYWSMCHMHSNETVNREELIPMW